VSWRAAGSGLELAAGQKRGFGIPVQRWLTSRWRADFDDTFHNSAFAAQGWVHKQGCLRPCTERR
jgi:hypothetical protein